MDDFQTVKLIGKGTFGSVYKCLNRKNKNYLGTKYIIEFFVYIKLLNMMFRHHGVD